MDSSSPLSPCRRASVRGGLAPVFSPSSFLHFFPPFLPPPHGYREDLFSPDGCFFFHLTPQFRVSPRLPTDRVANSHLRRVNPVVSIFLPSLSSIPGAASYLTGQQFLCRSFLISVFGYGLSIVCLPMSFLFFHQVCVFIKS